MIMTDKIKLKYNFDDKPPLFIIFLQALQWVVLILPPLVIVASTIAKLDNFTYSEEANFLAKIFLISGIFQILQLKFGHKLPLLVGPSTALMLGFVLNPNASLEEISFASIIIGILILILAKSNIIKKLLILQSKGVTVSVLLLIGISLIPISINLAFSSVPFTSSENIIFILILSGITIFFSKQSFPLSKFSIFFFMSISSIIFLTFIKPLNSEHIINNNLISFQKLKFDFTTTISFLFCYLGVVINEIGSTQSFFGVLNISPSLEKTNRGILFDAISGIFSGIIGSVGTVSYSLTPALIAMTQNASKYSFYLVGLIFILSSLNSSVIGIFAHIPTQVIAASLLVVGYIQIEAAIKLSKTEKGYHSFYIGIISFLGYLIIPYLFSKILILLPELNILAGLFLNGFSSGLLSAIIAEIIYKNFIMKTTNA
uniref:Xanthine permease n=1 Tax=Thermodesulfobium narugense TaxID=184064 RepID=A0A7C5KDJ5_9BACT